LTPSSPDADIESRPRISSSGLVGIALALGVFAILAWSVGHSSLGRSAIAASAPAATMQQIGDALMHRYALPLEVIGLMLTAALIGAVTLAMKESQAPQ
jgi:NADH-quinone oxidoreductase subunit J